MRVPGVLQVRTQRPCFRSARSGRIRPTPAWLAAFGEQPLLRLEHAARAAVTDHRELGVMRTSVVQDHRRRPTTRMNHLWSAGMTYHGAGSVLVWRSTSSYACW